MEKTKKETDRPTLFLIDGSNYVYRAFYAIKELSNSKGFPTNAIYGFTNMLIKLCRDWQPDYIAVVFDSKGPTFRHEAYDLYKANRKTMPDELIPQIPYIKDVVRGFSIPVIERQGVEADDIIGTLVKNVSGKKMKTVIVSGDKDLMQLVSDDAIMIDTMKDAMYDVEGVTKRFGVGPKKVVDILGLAGDTSDNIPGVPGIGEKTALKLIKEFGTLEGVLENVDKIKGERMRDNLKKFADQARLSHSLATVKTDVPIDFDPDEFRYGEPDAETLKNLFREFEFSSLVRMFKIKEEDRQVRYASILSESEFGVLLEKLRDAEEFSLDLRLTSEEPMKAEIIGISICVVPGEAFYIPLLHSNESAGKQLGADFVLKGLAPVFCDGNIKKHGHNLKNAFIVLSKKGIDLKGTLCDVMIASYVLNPSKRNFGLHDTAREYCSQEIISVKDLTGSGPKAIPFEGVPLEKAANYSCQRADFISRTVPIVSEKIEEEGFGDLFYNVEMPLVEVLASMEKKGVLIDSALLGEMSIQLGELLALSEKKIHSLAGEKFNINSPKQLQTVLFEKLGLPKGRKTKTGYSTDIDVLTFLGKSYELPAEIAAYRNLSKLRSTYVEALPALVNPQTQRVHTSYNQTATSTGRLSSSNPNLQNIPIRTVESRRIRQAFIAPEGYEIVSADYSQIELRILGHLSGDAILIDAFKSGEDIHARTASDVFGVFPNMVNGEMRRQAKVINFGIIYGMSPFGLSKELGISQKRAKMYIDEYFGKFEGVKKFIDDTIEKARDDGFVTTLMKRKRYIPEITSKNSAVRQFAERTAVNTPIQGTAADIIKVAMLNIWRELKKRELLTSMIMQVHDELVFEVPSAEKDEVTELVRHMMENVVELEVPLRVEISAGANWDEAHA